MNPMAVNEREKARKSDGKFGTQKHGAPDSELPNPNAEIELPFQTEEMLRGWNDLLKMGTGAAQRAA